MTVTIDISEDMEHKLREEAARHGQDLPDYILRLLARQVEHKLGRQGSVMQLHGIGKSTWRGVDIASYISAERDEWDKPA